MHEDDILDMKKAGALALDIMQNRLHLPLEGGKINEDKINDHIVIAMYSGDLGPIKQNIIDMAIKTVQEMVDIARKP